MTRDPRLATSRNSLGSGTTHPGVLNTTPGLPSAAIDTYGDGDWGEDVEDILLGSRPAALTAQVHDDQLVESIPEMASQPAIDTPSRKLAAVMNAVTPGPAGFWVVTHVAHLQK